jgi:hypothetical protein
LRPDSSSALRLLRQSSLPSSQSDGWVTLVDSTKMGDWDKVGDANWEMKDGALAADKLLSGKDLAYLVSKTPYKDFQIKAEFWTDAEANSGIFIRCDNPKVIDGKTCYEVNIFDKRPDPSYGTGAIVDVAKVNPMPKAADKWNTYEITAKGPKLTVISVMAGLVPAIHVFLRGKDVDTRHSPGMTPRAGKGMDVRPHPHIGLATVTYLFDGAIMHRDSEGNVREIQPGAMNLMTAGKGIAHSERTPDVQRRDGQKMLGLQSWIALPKGSEEIAPSFQHYAADSLPTITDTWLHRTRDRRQGVWQSVAGVDGVAMVLCRSGRRGRHQRAARSRP